MKLEVAQMLENCRTIGKDAFKGCEELYQLKASHDRDVLEYGHSLVPLVEG